MGVLAPPLSNYYIKIWLGLCLVLFVCPYYCMSFQQQQQDNQSGSFHSDNTVTTFRLISAIAAVTVATSSVFLWRIRRTSPAEAKHDTEPITPAPSSLQTAVPHDVVPLQDPKGKASRSKERRRRGKDLFKELSRGSKKHKELHRQLNRHSTTSLTEQDHPQLEASPVKSSGLSHVQIPGPSQLGELAPNVVDDPRPSIDRPQDVTVSRSLAGKFDLPALSTNEERPMEDRLPSQDNEVVPPDASEEPCTSQVGPCEASIDLLAAPSRVLGSHTPSPSQGRPHSGVTSEWDGQLSEPPPRFAAVRATNLQSSSCPSLCSPASFSPTDNHLALSDVSSPTLLTCPSPALRVGLRRMPTSHLPSPSPNPVSAQTQIASLRGALEAARLREEKSRMEAECRAKEYDALRRRWMEEITSRQHREAQVHYTTLLDIQILINLTSFMPTYNTSLMCCRCMQVHTRP